jgi:hypothetical protein
LQHGFFQTSFCEFGGPLVLKRVNLNNNGLYAAKARSVSGQIVSSADNSRQKKNQQKSAQMQ